MWDYPGAVVHDPRPATKAARIQESTMPTTAAAIFEHISPPASVRDITQFTEQHLSGGAEAATRTSDPTPMLCKSLDRLRLVQEGLATLSVESANDRAAMRKAAADTGRVARLYYDLHAEMVESGVPDSHPVATMCEELAAGLEDLAETAALAGSERFARMIAQEIADARAES